MVMAFLSFYVTINLLKQNSYPLKLKNILHVPTITKIYRLFTSLLMITMCFFNFIHCIACLRTKYLRDASQWPKKKWILFLEHNSKNAHPP